MAGDVSLTVRISGAPEVQAQLKQIAGSAQQVTQATERATESTRNQQQVFTGARQSVSALSSAMANASSLTRTFGLEQTILGRALEGATAVLYATTAGLQSVRAGLIAVKTAGLALIGPLALIVGGAIALGLGLDALSTKLEQSESALGRFLRRLQEFDITTGFPKWLRDIIGGDADRVVQNFLEIRAAQEKQMALLPQMTHALREHGQTFAGIATGAYLADKAIEQMTAREKAAAEAAARAAEADAKRAKALAEIAAAAKLAAQELVELVRADNLMAEIWQVLVPRGLEMANALHGVVLEARDYLIVQRELADLDFAQFLKEQVPWLIQLGKAWEGVASEAARVRGWLGQVTDGLNAVSEAIKELPTFVGTVVTSIAPVFTTLQQFGIETARSVSDAFTSALVQGQNVFKALIDAILAQVARLAANWLFMQIFGWLFPPARLFAPFANPFGPIPLPGLTFPGLQHGGSMVVSRPTPLMVGEAGAERVTVTPLARPFAGAGAGGGNVIFNAPVFLDDITASQLYRRYIEPAQQRAAARRVG